MNFLMVNSNMAVQGCGVGSGVTEGSLPLACSQWRGNQVSLPPHNNYLLAQWGLNVCIWSLQWAWEEHVLPAHTKCILKPFWVVPMHQEGPIQNSILGSKSNIHLVKCVFVCAQSVQVQCYKIRIWNRATTRTSKNTSKGCTHWPAVHLKSQWARAGSSPANRQCTNTRLTKKTKFG